MRYHTRVVLLQDVARRPHVSTLSYYHKDVLLQLMVRRDFALVFVLDWIGGII